MLTDPPPHTQQNTESIFYWVSIQSLLLFTNEEISENQIRWWLRSKETNGLGKYTRTIGRKIYIHKYGFMKWFEEEAAA